MSELSVCVCVSLPMPVLWIWQQVPPSADGARVRSHCRYLVCGRYYGIWHEWNVLTISKVEVLASWGGAEDGTGWELAIAVHESLSYSKGIMPDYGAKQGALSVSLLVLGKDSIWTGLTAVPGCSAPDTQASNKSACDGCVFLNLC